MSQYQSRHRVYHRRRKPNIYEKRSIAQKRNKQYKHQHQRQTQQHHDYYQNFRSNQNHQTAIDTYSGDENESVDSTKKWRKLQSEISSIFIPQFNKNESYDEHGHVMFLTATSNTNNFDLSRFVHTITNRNGINVMQRAKLLKVEIISSQALKLKITVSSPSIFRQFIHSENKHNIITINNISFKHEVPKMYQVKSQCKSLKLCIKPCSANQDYAIWSSLSDYYHHQISYYVQDKEHTHGLSVHIGNEQGTEYMLTINPSDIYRIQYRDDCDYNSEHYLKIKMLRPCSIYKLPITTDDHSYRLIFPPLSDDFKCWINAKGKIFRQCGNEHIYNDSQRNNNEAIYHRHAEHSSNYKGYQAEIGIDSSLEMLPKLIGKSLVLFFVFDGTAKPQKILNWLKRYAPSEYNWFTVSPTLIPPPYYGSKNEYRDNLLSLRGGDIVDETVIDYIDMLVSAARIADDHMMHEQELTSSFIQIVSDYKYKERFCGYNKENINQVLLRSALNYYSCLTVKSLKNKMLLNSQRAMLQSHNILQFLLEDTARRSCDGNDGSLLISEPFSTRNAIEIKRCLVTPTRIIQCPTEHWPLSNIFGWIVDNQCMNNLLFITFVTEDFEPFPCSEIDAQSNEFAFILKKYVLNGLNDGRIIICNRTYFYLFSTPQLFRHRTLCFFQTTKYTAGKRVHCMQLLNRLCRPKLTTNGIMTQYAMQRFMPSMTTIKGSEIQFVETEDDCHFLQGLMPTNWAKNRLLDKLLRESTRKLSQYRLNKNDFPSLIRFAYKGYFGTLTVNPMQNEQRFIFTKSQKKYRFQQRDDMEIYEFSSWKPAYLKANHVIILRSLGIDEHIFYKLFKDRLKFLDRARKFDADAIHLLANMDCVDIPVINSSMNGYKFDQSVWIKALRNGMLRECEVFLSKFMQVMVENEVKLLQREYKLMLDYENGALLFGCFDELRILKENEVFIQTFDKEKEEWSVWNDETLLVFNESHCYYPSDMIVIRCCNTNPKINELAHLYRNVIVFPHPSVICRNDQNRIPIFYRCGGATLDGENKFVCIRNEQLLPKQNALKYERIKYPQIRLDNLCRVIQPEPETNGDEEIKNKKSLHNESVSEQNMGEYAYSILSNDGIDYEILEYLWFSHADADGAHSQMCRELSNEIYKAKKYHLLQLKLNDISKFDCPSIPSWLNINKSLFRKPQSFNKSMMYWIKTIIDKKIKSLKLYSKAYGYDVILHQTKDCIERKRANGTQICDNDLMLELEKNLREDEEPGNECRTKSEWKRLFNSHQFISEILALKQAFEFELFLKCKQFGIVNECELLSYKLLNLETKRMAAMDWNEYHLMLNKRKQFLCGRDESYSMQMVLSKTVHDMMCHYRRKLIGDHDTESHVIYAKAMYIYYVVYKQNFEIVKSRQECPFPSLLFAWILADYWLAIKITVRKQNRNFKPLVDREYIEQNMRNELYRTPAVEVMSKCEDDDDCKNDVLEERQCPIPDFEDYAKQNEDEKNEFDHQMKKMHLYPTNTVVMNEYDEYEYDGSIVIDNYSDVEKYYKCNMRRSNATNCKNLDSLQYKGNKKDSCDEAPLYKPHEANHQQYPSRPNHNGYEQTENYHHRQNRWHNQNKSRKVIYSSISPHIME